MKIIMYKSKCHGSFNAQNIATDAFRRKRNWWWDQMRPRVARHTMTHYTRESFVAAAQYKAALEFEEAIAELRSVLAQ